ncbi:MAG TPA: 8-amino-7-oxononanoate synthase [Puia sp.]|jgi:8-amino-7-oxononanoate synthase|nr:8-amino-7-oxononanoate synthase [Puia sp.]
MGDEGFLNRRLEERIAQDAFRQLRLPEGKTDFCSNDYLGIVANGLLEGGNRLPEAGPGHPDGRAAAASSLLAHGSAGSRLLAGNYPLIEETEKALAGFHQAEAGLLFNSGYDANLGVLSCIPRRGDTIVYDSLSHASIRDGIRLSFAQSFSFAHNDCADLERRFQAVRGEERNVAAAKTGGGNLFVVTESVFSMDGDLAPLETILSLCRRYNAYLILDEAHATGVIGKEGEGLAQAGGLHRECFARIHTFGKAVGCHGAIVLGSTRLRQFLINFCRPLIYTTALPPASVRAIADAYRLFPKMNEERTRLQQLTDRWRQAAIGYERLNSPTPIQVVIVPGNAAVRALAGRLQEAGLDIRPILYPTVPKGSERLRIVVHSFNTVDEIDRLTELLRS